MKHQSENSEELLDWCEFENVFLQDRLGVFHNFCHHSLISYVRFEETSWCNNTNTDILWGCRRGKVTPGIKALLTHRHGAGRLSRFVPMDSADTECTRGGLQISKCHQCRLSQILKINLCVITDTTSEEEETGMLKGPLVSF